MDLKSLIDQPGKLPVIPKVTQQLIASFSSDSVSVDEIVHMLAADPALSAKLLRLANSAYFHVSRTIGTVHDAVLMLGFVMVRNLVVGNGMVTAFKNTKGMDLHQFWLHNLYTACAARWLATKGGENGDFVFTLGMMHGIGQLQMHVGMPDEMLQIDKQLHVLDVDRAALEQQELGFHYGEVSAELARVWNFPDSLIDALRAIPAPLSSPAFSAPAAWVHLGAWRSRVDVLAMHADDARALYPEDVAARLGLAPTWTPLLDDQLKASSKSVMPPLGELAEGLDAMLS